MDIAYFTVTLWTLTSAWMLRNDFKLLCMDSLARADLYTPRDSQFCGFFLQIFGYFLELRMIDILWYTKFFLSKSERKYTKVGFQNTKYPNFLPVAIYFLRYPWRSETCINVKSFRLAIIFLKKISVRIEKIKIKWVVELTS